MEPSLQLIHIEWRAMQLYAGINAGRGLITKPLRFG